MFLFPVLWVSVAGCQRGDLPDLGRVHGTVTLDGKPLAGVIVRFFPEVGRAGTATTEADGRYNLIFSHHAKGAQVGINNVSFAWPDGEPGPVRIPNKYGAESELTVEVKPGKNTFDFHLESE